MKRREFLKNTAAGIAAIGSAAAVFGCGAPENDSSTKGIPEAGPVDKRTALGDEVSLLGYGCMRWPRKKDENGKRVPDQEAINELVDYAIAHGVNYFDSSPRYMDGKSEEAAATALLRHPRESYFIATKLSIYQLGTFDEYLKMYRRSFEIYQTDYIDYYLLHALSDGKDFKERFLDNGFLKFLQEEKAAGRIRHLGFSFHGKEKGFDELMALHDTYHWDFVQIQMNWLDWNHAEGRNGNASHMYAELEKRHIPVVIMEPLFGGQLAKLPSNAVNRLKAIEPDRSVASWAFRFCGSFPEVLTVLSGMDCMEHLQDNIRTFTGLQPLGGTEMELLERIAETVSQFPLIRCTACQYCMPCPFGIDIPGIFKFYNTEIRERSFDLNENQKSTARQKRKFLLKYDKAVASLAQADHCIACGRCVSRCPQRIAIPKEISRIDKFIESV